MARRIKKSKKIILYVILACLIICFLDIFMKPTYMVKSVIKIILFLIIPFLLVKKRDKSFMKKFIKPKKEGFFKSVFLGIGLLALVLFLYFLLQDVYDFNKIIPLLAETGINSSNFWFVCFHVSLINSLVEEFFFRGYSFLLLKRSIKTSYAYLFSSLMFAIYHITIIYKWFSVPIFVCSILCLMLLGFVLNYLDEKNENIYNSWMSHMFVNFGINTIGLMLMGML